MTVIAAVADDTGVWMAADTGEPVGGTWHGAARKIRRVQLPNGGGEILLGVAGGGGLMALAERAIPTCDDPCAIPGDDLDTWADFIARHLTEAAATAVPPMTEPDRDGMTVLSGMWMLGYRGRLWHLLTHHALPVPDGVTASGVGADLALGYMLGARDLARYNSGSPVYGRDLAAGAVKAAVLRIPYCSAPDGPIIEHLLGSDHRRTP